MGGLRAIDLEGVFRPFIEAARTSLRFRLEDLGAEQTYADPVRAALADEFFDRVFVDRIELQEITSKLERPYPLVITGERGSGKSTLIRRFLWQNGRGMGKVEEALDTSRATHSVHVYDMVDDHTRYKRGPGAGPRDKLCGRLLTTLTEEILEGKRGAEPLAGADTRFRLYHAWLLKVSEAFRPMKQLLITMHPLSTGTANEWVQLLAHARDEQVLDALTRYESTSSEVRLLDLLVFLSSWCQHGVTLFVDNTDHLQLGDEQAEIVESLFFIQSKAELAETFKPVISIRDENYPAARERAQGTAAYFERVALGREAPKSPSGDVYRSFARRRLEILGDPKLGIVEAVASHRDAERLADILDLSSPDQLVAAQIDSICDLLDNALDGNMYRDLRRWFNDSFRHIGQFLIRLSSDLTSLTFEETGTIDQLVIARERQLFNSLILRLFLTVNGPDAIRELRHANAPEVLHLLSRPGFATDEPFTLFARMRVLENLHARNGFTARVEDVLDAMEAAGCSRERTARALNGIARQRDEDDEGLVRLDPREWVHPKGNGEMKVVLLSAGEWLVEYLAATAEFLFLSALSTHPSDLQAMNSDWAGWTPGRGLSTKQAQDPLFRIRLAVEYFVEYLVPNHLRQFGSTFSGGQVPNLAGLTGPEKHHLRRYADAFISSDDYPCRVLTVCQGHIERLAIDFPEHADEVLALKERMAAAVEGLDFMWTAFRQAGGA